MQFQQIAAGNEVEGGGAGVSIVIRSFNEQKYIGACLDSIRAQRFNFPLEVVVVDSGSDDETVEIARSRGCHIVEIDRGTFSFGGALNLGVARASQPVIVSLSAHCIPVSETWLDCLVAPILAGRAVMTFGAHVAGENARTSEKNYFREKYDLPIGACRRPAFNNGNSAFLKRVWSLRAFDELLPAQEDMEFCMWHMRNSGAVLIYESRALVVHYHNDNNWNVYRRLYKELAVEFYLGEQSWGGLLGFFISLPVFLRKDFSLAQRAGVLLRAFRGIVTFRLMQTAAYLHAAVSYRRFLKRRVGHEHRQL